MFDSDSGYMAQRVPVGGRTIWFLAFSATIPSESYRWVRSSDLDTFTGTSIDYC